MGFPLIPSTIKISGKTLYVDRPFQGAGFFGHDSPSTHQANKQHFQ